MNINKKIVSSVLALSVVLSTLGIGATGASADEYKIQYNDEYNTPSYIVEKWAPNKKGLSKRDIAFSYLGENSKRFKLKGDMKKHFKVTKEEADNETGTYHVRLVEQHEGVPVFGSDSAIALDDNNNVTSFFGQVVPDLENEDIDTEVIISEEEAIEKAKQAIEKKIGKVDEYDGEIEVEQFIYEFEDAFYNTYLVTASTVNPKVGYWHYFVDATNGNIIDNYNAAHDVTAFGVGVFGNRQKLETQLSDGKFILKDVTRGKGIITYDQSSGRNVDASSISKSFLDGSAVDAHAYAADTYDYYLKTFGRDSYDDNGAELISHVHVGTNWNNASWNGRSMNYGDGDGILFLPLAGGKDVVAHELTHAVTSATSNLIYRNESGALNESMSDIFGNMVHRDDRWLIGADIVADKSRIALRSMRDPTEIVDVRTENGFSPDHWKDRYTGSLDSGGVHINSSINNKAAYLISQGGEHYGVIVKGVGREATEQIYYRANTKYLVRSSNFSMMREAAIQSATDLYGSESKEVKAVQAAYTAVGVNDSSTNIELENGMTNPIYSTDDAIIEELFVETTVDSDRDGKFDRVSIQVMRPKTDPGIKVPVIYEISPYRSGLNPISFYDVNHELTPVPESYDGFGGKPYALASAQPANLGTYGNYYVPRGYAVILGESIGTGKSDGCPTTGDYNETKAAKAVIDWLNGSAKAFTADGTEVSADWSTGHVGMTGVSYNGTLPNAVATTGVEGLKTIIPIAAISSWYDYYRSNGSVIAPGGYQGEDADVLAKAVLTRKKPEVCQTVIDEITAGQDRSTGDYNDFWAARDYLGDVDKINASVFIVHGLNDWNVKTKQFDQWWSALEENNVDRKMWLHTGGHGGTSTNNWRQTENRWFDHWLYGIENGIMDEPAVDIQRENRTWHQQSNWPEATAVPVKLQLGTVQESATGVLSSLPLPDKPNEQKSIIDDPMKKADLLIADPELDSPNRLVYLTPELTEEVRISGTPTVSIKASIDRPVANLTALLVDYSGSRPTIVTRGWKDPQNLHSDDHSERLIPNKEYTFTWDMQPDDYVFQPGSQIGLVLIASDYDYTIRPSAGTKVTITPTSSEFILPIVGGLK